MKHLSSSLLFVILFLQNGFCQKITSDDIKNIGIRSIGPAAMSGRVTAIDVNLTTGTIYAGAASGGVWKSDNSGVAWTPIFDKQPIQAIGAIQVNQKNPDDIWVGTGEGNPRNSQNSGIGIFRSIDGGENWTNMGLRETKTIHRIIIHRDDPNTVLVAATGSAWGSNPDRGVFKTTDGGKSWRKVLFVNDSTGCADLVVDPLNPNKLFAAMWEYGRKPWTFNSGGAGSGLYVSYDGGETWTKRTDKDGLPKGNLGRMGLAIARSNPQIVYAIVEAAADRGVYRSDNGGVNWRKMGETGGRPFYYNEIYVDPRNENRIYSIHSTITKSENGGENFDNFAGWIIHPDHHAFWIHPENSDYIINGNDGGLNITHDRGKNWQFSANLPLGQFYHVNVDNEFPYNVYGGLQDNGSWVGPSSVWASSGIRNSEWQEVQFGDGFDVMPRRDNARYGYSMSQGGNLIYYDRKTGESMGIAPLHPDFIPLRFNWNAGLAQNPFYDRGIYYGSQFLHKSLDCGQSWEIISPDLTTNDSTKLKQAQSGGLTIDATTAENHCTILCIAPSPKDEKVIWVGTDDGNIQLTTNGGQTWTNHSLTIPGLPKNAWIPQIEASRHQAGEAFVVVNNYRQNDWAPYLFHTSDFGKTWKRLADSKQIESFCLSVVQDTEVPDLLFLGTDQGLYFSIDKGTNWNKWHQDFPSVPVNDMKIQEREADLVLATFGRSIWIMDNIRPLREIARTKGALLKENFKIVSAPDAYQLNYRSYQGERFSASSTYEGVNDSYGAQITAWHRKDSESKSPKGEESKSLKSEESKSLKSKSLKSEESNSLKSKSLKPEEPKSPVAEMAQDSVKGKDKKVDDGKVKVVVLSLAGDTIRSYKTEIDTGFVNIYWGMERDGVRFPSWEDPEPDAGKPWGGSVLPGTYKIKCYLGEYVDSTMITVHYDPRSPLTLNDLRERQKAQDDFNKTISLAAETFSRLREAKKTIGKVQDMLVNVPDSLKENVIKTGKNLQDSLSNMMKVFTLPRDFRGIDSVTPTLNGALWNARGYLGDAPGKPGANAMAAVAQARKEVADIVTRVNAFFEKDWAEYRKATEAIQFSLFKEYPVLGN